MAKGNLRPRQEPPRSGDYSRFAACVGFPVCLLKNSQQKSIVHILVNLNNLGLRGGKPQKFLRFLNMDQMDDIEKPIPKGGNVSSSNTSNRRESILPVTPSRSGLGGRTSDSASIAGSANESAHKSTSRIGTTNVQSSVKALVALRRVERCIPKSPNWGRFGYLQARLDELYEHADALVRDADGNRDEIIDHIACLEDRIEELGTARHTLDERDTSYVEPTWT